MYKLTDSKSLKWQTSNGVINLLTYKLGTTQCIPRYVGCLQNETLTPHPLTYCTELRPLKLDPLPTTLNVLYGQNVILQCKLSEGSGIPVEVCYPRHSFPFRDRLTV